jgi:outer membrane lipoprotein-sorting protein
MLGRMASRRLLSGRLRWAVPAVAAAAVAAAVTVPSTFATAGPPDLPERSAAELLAALGSSEITALAGTVVQTSRLGLPELPTGPGGGAAGGTGPMALLSGSNTMRVWYDGPERTRVALLGELAEYTVVRNGQDAWTYSSERDEAVHYDLPAPGAGHAGEQPAQLPTPADAAEAALAAIEPSTEVRVEQTARVAGRDAYQLLLDPRDDRSLVESIRVVVDAETSTPLRVQVWSAQDTADPALEIGFTDISYERPDPSVFDFAVPPGTEVREVMVPRHHGDGKNGASADAGAPGAPGGAPLPPPSEGAQPVQVVGTGWTSVLSMAGVDTGSLVSGGLASGENAAVLDQLTTQVPEGRLLSTALLTVLMTDDGRVLAGAVPADLLREVAQ